MKKFLAILLALMFISTGAVASFSTGVPPENNCKDSVPLYRFWNSETGDHFYTTDENEKNRVLTTKEWMYTYEGIAAYVYQTQQTNTLPLYRLWSSKTGDHFYTTDENEKNTALTTKEWMYTYEGIAGYIYPAQQTNTLPLYRLWNSENNDHFYTTSETEKNRALEGQYIYEGIAGYACKSVTFDSSGPEIISATPSNGSFVAGTPVTVRAFVRDKGNKVRKVVIGANGFERVFDNGIYGAEGKYYSFALPTGIADGTVVNVTVTAYDLFNNQGKLQWYFTIDLGAPDAIDDLKATLEEGNKVYLEWTGPSNTGSPIGGYRIYRATQGITEANKENYLLATVSSTYYRDTGTESDTKYYYRAEAFDGAWHSASLSNQVIAKTGHGQASFIELYPSQQSSIHLGRNDISAVVLRVKNTANERKCISLDFDTDERYIDVTLSSSSFCLNSNEETRVTATVKTSNAPKASYKLEFIAHSGSLESRTDVSVVVGEEPEIELVAYPSELCRGSQDSISVLVRNNSDEFKQVRLQAENEMLLPYFEKQEIDLMPFQERYVNLVVNTSPYSTMAGRHNVSIYAITSDETVKESIALDIKDCKEDNAEFSVSISNSCFTVEKGKDEKIYFGVKNLLGGEQKVFFSAGGDIGANLQTQSAWLEGNEQRQFYFTVNVDKQESIADYSITLQVWNADHSVEKSVCVTPKKVHSTLAEVKENNLLVRQCESVIFTVLLKNQGDYYEDFRLSIDNSYSKVKATLSDQQSLRLEKHSERQVYVSVTALEGLPEGSYSITLNVKTSQGTIKKTLNFKVLPKQAGPEPQQEQALQISGYPSSISMDANSEKTIFALLKNGSDETMDNISIELLSLPAGVTAQSERNIRLLPGKERHLELAITAGPESSGQHSIVLSAYNGTYSEEKQITLSIQKAGQQAADITGGLAGLFAAGGSALLGLAILALAIIAIVLIAGALSHGTEKEIWMRG